MALRNEDLWEELLASALNPDGEGSKDKVTTTLTGPTSAVDRGQSTTTGSTTGGRNTLQTTDTSQTSQGGRTTDQTTSSTDTETGSRVTDQTETTQSTTTRLDPTSAAALQSLIQALMSGGTPEQLAGRALRGTEIDALRNQRQDYSKAAAFLDAQGAVNYLTGKMYEQEMGNLARAVAGAGTSSGALQAVLRQNALDEAIGRGAALSLDTAVNYGNIGVGLSGILEQLTRPDSQTTDALIQALQIAKGATESTTGTRQISGTELTEILKTGQVDVHGRETSYDTTKGTSTTKGEESTFQDTSQTVDTVGTSDKGPSASYTFADTGALMTPDQEMTDLYKALTGYGLGIAPQYSQPTRLGGF